MPWPRLQSYAIKDNPVLFSPFVENNAPGEGGQFVDTDFLLLDGEFFLLMDGTHFLTFTP